MVSEEILLKDQAESANIVKAFHFITILIYSSLSQIYCKKTKNLILKLFSYFILFTKNCLWLFKNFLFCYLKLFSLCIN